MQKEKKNNIPGAQAPSPAVAAAAITADVDDGGVNVGGRHWWKEGGSGSVGGSGFSGRNEREERA